MEIIISVAAIIISVVSGIFTIFSFTWTARRDRKRATLDAWNRLQNQALDRLNYYSPQRIAEIITDPRSDEFKELGGYIARIEHFCVGVNRKIYDRKTVYELAHGYFDGSLRKRIEPVIERKNYSGHDYYENIHAVYKWMDKKSAR